MESVNSLFPMCLCFWFVSTSPQPLTTWARLRHPSASLCRSLLGWFSFPLCSDHRWLPAVSVTHFVSFGKSSVTYRWASQIPGDGVTGSHVVSLPQASLLGLYSLLRNHFNLVLSLLHLKPEMCPCPHSTTCGLSTVSSLLTQLFHHFHNVASS